MARAKQPVTINGIAFDALIDEDLTLEATVPEYAVEGDFSVSDAILLGAESLSMTLFVTNTPVTWAARNGVSRTRVSEVVAQLKDLYYSKATVVVATTDSIYEDMAIENISLSKSLNVGYSREIPIKFRRVRKTKTKVTTIPSTYGKSGETAQQAGTAGVTAGSSSARAGSGSSSSSGSSGRSSGSGGSSSGSGGKGSILYNAGKAVGLIKK